MERIGTKWNLRRDIHFRTRVISLKWLEDEAKWKVRIRKDEDERDEYADVIVSAQGFLR